MDDWDVIMQIYLVKFFWIFFALGIATLAVLLFMQITFINRDKRKTNRNGNIFRHVGLWEFLTPTIIIINWFAGLISIFTFLISYLIKFHSSEWYREHMKIKGEHTVILKFLNHISDSDTVNIYRKRDTETKSIENLLRTNIDLFEKITEANFYADIIEIYLNNHPELTLEDLENEEEELTEREEDLLEEISRLEEEVKTLKISKRQKQSKPKERSTIGKSKPEKGEESGEDGEDGEDFLQDKEKSLKIFKRIFHDMFFHRVFFSFDFFELEFEEDISSDIQALILSKHQELPNDMILTCGLLDDEIVEGKTFTTIFAWEGVLDEDIAKWVNIKCIDLEIFKALPSPLKMDRLASKVEALQIMLEEQVQVTKEVAHTKLSIDAANQRHVTRFQVPIPTSTNHKQKKRKWSREEDED